MDARRACGKEFLYPRYAVSALTTQGLHRDLVPDSLAKLHRLVRRVDWPMDNSPGTKRMVKFAVEHDDFFLVLALSRAGAILCDYERDFGVHRPGMVQYLADVDATGSWRAFFAEAIGHVSVTQALWRRQLPSPTLRGALSALGALRIALAAPASVLPVILGFSL